MLNHHMFGTAGPTCAMRYTTLPTTGPEARISRAVTHYRIWYLEVRLQQGATIALPFSKNITCFTHVFLRFAEVSQFCSAVSVFPFVSCLRLTGRVSIIIL